MDDNSSFSNIDTIWNGGRSGIVNLGQTCYMATAIQVISQIDEIKSLYLDDGYLEDINFSKPESKFCKEFSRLLKGMWEENCIVQPVSFRKMLINFDNIYAGNTQHDLSEALGKILDLLHIGTSYAANITYEGNVLNNLDKLMITSIKTWGSLYDKEYSEILELFYGQYILKINNKSTGKTKISYTFDPFNILTLQIDDCDNIYKCLDKFVLSETLDDENKISSVIKIWKSPKYLIIQLKRFDGKNNKDNRFIDYPIKGLNLEKYNTGYDRDDAKYDLISVGIHIGVDNLGHYYAYTLHKSNWYRFDDSSIFKINENDIKNKVVNKNAYILIYKKI